MPNGIKLARAAEPPQMQTTDQTAAILGVSPGHLANQRSRGTSPLPYCRIGSAIRYRLSDIEALIESSRVAA